MRRIFTFLLFAGLFSAAASAQDIDRNSFQPIDSFVYTMGSLDNYGVNEIADSITKTCITEVEKTRAIYVWIATNIGYDTRAYHHPAQYNINISTALKERRTLCDGYAMLYKAMCDHERILCEVIDGVSKTNTRSIGKTHKKDKHTWNSVYVNKKWYLVDATWGAGITDAKVHRFDKKFTDAWWFTNRKLFALSHFPDKPKFQYLDTPVTKPQFLQAPIIGASAVINEVYPTPGMRGNFRAKSDTNKVLVFKVKNPALITSLSASSKKDPTHRRIPYTINNDELTVKVPFKKKGKYPVTLYVNDNFAFAYKADVKKHKKKVVHKKPAPKKPAPKKPAPPKEK